MDLFRGSLPDVITIVRDSSELVGGRRCRVKGVLGVLVAAVLAAAGSQAGTFVALHEPPRPSACIIVLGGGGPGRLQEALRLWRRGIARYVVLSGGAPYGAGLTQAEAMAKSAIAAGVPRSDLRLDNQSQTTLQNATDTRPILQRAGWTSAVVVSSVWHMRRVSVLFDTVYAGTGIRLTFTPAPDPYYDPTRWWSNARSRDLTVEEYAKLAVNVLELLWRGIR